GTRDADLLPIPVGIRTHQRAADHRGDRCDDPGPPRALRAPQDPARVVHRAVPARWTPDSAARPRCLRAAQCGGHSRPTARRIALPAVGARGPGTAAGQGEGHASRPRFQRLRLHQWGRGCVMNPMNYVYLSALLFTIGAAGVLLRRNAIVMFMCVELMLNAVNLAFVTFARLHGRLDGQMVAFFTMVVAACEVVIGLAIIMTIFRARKSASVDDANLLKG